MTALGLLFAKDKLVEFLKKGMSKNQQDMFKEEIEERKRGEGRGGADNLTEKIIKAIAKMIKEMFK